MELTTKQLRNIIREELSRVLREAVSPEQKIELENIFVAALGEYQEKLEAEPAYKQYTQQIIDMLNDGLIEDATLIAADYPEILAHILVATERQKFDIDGELITFMSLLYRKDPSGMNFIDYLAETPAADIIQGYKFRNRRISKERKKAGKNKEMCESTQSEYEKYQVDWENNVASRGREIEQLRKEIDRELYYSKTARDEPRYRGLGSNIRNKHDLKVYQLKDQLRNLKSLMDDWSNPDALKAAKILMNAGDRNCAWVKDIYIAESLRYAIIMIKKEVFKPSRNWDEPLNAPEAERLIDKAIAYGNKNNINVAKILSGMDKDSQGYINQHYPEKLK